MKIHDRYSASKTPRPDVKTTCHPCEGMGFIPRKRPNDPRADHIGYVFERCDKCGGTGRNDGTGKAVTDAQIAQKVAAIKGAIGGK